MSLVGGTKGCKKKNVRHREVEVCEDEKSEMSLLGNVTSECDEGGNNGEVEFEEIES